MTSGRGKLKENCIYKNLIIGLRYWLRHLICCFYTMVVHLYMSPFSLIIIVILILLHRKCSLCLRQNAMHLISYFNTGSSCCNVQACLYAGFIDFYKGDCLIFATQRDAQASPFRVLYIFFRRQRLCNWFFQSGFLCVLGGVEWFNADVADRQELQGNFFFQQRPHHMYAAFPWPCTYQSKNCQWLNNNNNNNDYNERVF